MGDFVRHGSVVREIWGKADTILLIFAGSAAEFALNKAVDWLYYTGKLPSDPLGRLFSTVTYARRIVLATEKDALNTIEKIATIHTSLEKRRNRKIPQWAYRDVLFMLIDYSIRSFEVLERPLNAKEKQEVYQVFYRVGEGMHLKDLPKDYPEFTIMREEHLGRDMEISQYTSHLFEQYRKHLGAGRYYLLLEAQKLVVPSKVRALLGYNRSSMLKPLINPYRLLKKVHLEWWVKSLLFPRKYLKDIKKLDIQ